MTSLDEQIEQLIKDSNSYQEESINVMKAQKARITELEVFADKVVNWNEQFSLKTRCDIGNLGQLQHFKQLAVKVLNNG